ncbi:MAG: SDR family oxidoreductase [Pseudomonadota bacterium]
MGSLNGKVALITGGGSGLGRAIVGRYLREGARVGVLERSAELAAGIECEFGDAISVTIGDVRSGADNQRAIAAVVSKFGRLDIFVGNAGIYDNRARLQDLGLNALDAGFDELFSVNVKGYLLGARAALDELRKTRGCILFTASVSSFAPGFGGVLYIAAKHAVVGLTRQLAWELGPDVRVNAVAPGYVPTGLRGLESLGQGTTATAPTAQQLPLRQMPTADDYAAYYVFLASEESSRTATGTILLADGGLALSGATRPQP